MAPANRERKQKTAGAKDEGVVFWTVPASAVKPRQPAAPKSTWEQFGEAVGHIRKVCEDYTRGLKNVLGELPAPSESPSPAETLPAEQLIETDVYRTLGSQETQSKDEWLEQAKKAHPKRRSETNRAWAKRLYAEMQADPRVDVWPDWKTLERGLYPRCSGRTGAKRRLSSSGKSQRGCVVRCTSGLA